MAKTPLTESVINDGYRNLYRKLMDEDAGFLEEFSQEEHSIGMRTEVVRDGKLDLWLYGNLVAQAKSANPVDHVKAKTVQSTYLTGVRIWQPPVAVKLFCRASMLLARFRK